MEQDRIIENARKASNVNNNLPKKLVFEDINGKSKNEIKTIIKGVIDQEKITNSDLLLVGLAVSYNEGTSSLELGVDAYAEALASEKYQKKEKFFEEKKQRASSVFTVIVDKERLKNSSKEQIAEYAETLINTEFPENVRDMPVSNITNLNIDFKENLPSGVSLREALPVFLNKSKVMLIEQEKSNKTITQKNQIDTLPEQQKQSSRDVFDAALKNMIENDNVAKEQQNESNIKAIYHEPTHSVIENEKPKDKSNINEAETAKKSVQKVVKQDEEEFDVSEVGEGTSNINYFVGYDKEGVNRLFSNKPKKFIKSFKTFIDRFNELMNKMLNQDLGEKTVDDLQNDLKKEFDDFSALCSNYGAEGVQIQNLCRGVVSIYEKVCDAEREGKNLDGLKLKANLETTQALDFTDRDGLRREDANTSEKGSSAPTLIKAIDNAVGTKGLINEDALTEEDQREIDMFGITGILTHSAMELFRREPEYKRLQSMNVFGLSKDDGTSV